MGVTGTGRGASAGCGVWRGRDRPASSGADEALFAIEGVLDFAAALSDNVLQITVQTETAGVESAARQAIIGLPAVQVARLIVSLQVQYQKLNLLGKRKFTYLNPIAGK